MTVSSLSKQEKRLNNQRLLSRRIEQIWHIERVTTRAGFFNHNHVLKINPLWAEQHSELISFNLEG